MTYRFFQVFFSMNNKYIMKRDSLICIYYIIENLAFYNVRVIYAPVQKRFYVFHFVSCALSFRVRDTLTTPFQGIILSLGVLAVYTYIHHITPH